MESLIIEQQLSVLRAYRLYEAFKQRVANTPLMVTQSAHSQALIRRDEYGPTPTSLVPYQEASLARSKPSLNETEDLARIRRISSSYVDSLLLQWTQLSDIEQRMRRVNLDQPGAQSPTSARIPRTEMTERRNSNWRQPLVESDDSDSDNGTIRNQRPRLHISTPGPVLMPANDDESADVVSPIPIPGLGANLRPSRGPFSPSPTSTSWTPGSNSYFPTGGSPRIANGRPRPSPAPSPLSSPRTSFSSDTPARPVTAFKMTENISQQQQRQPIPYRLRQRQNYWDYIDKTFVGSNTQIPVSSALRERNGTTYTEIMSEFVSRDALKKLRYDYTRVKKDTGDRHGRTRLETCYCVEGALSFNEIQRLVDRTREIRFPPPRSPRTSRPGAPSLDRSYTAPGSLPRHSSYSTSSIPSDSDSSSSRRRERERREKSRGRRESDAKKGGGAATLTKLAMGAGGMLTLLDGLPEVLGYI
jgi:hypothetical protein